MKTKNKLYSLVTTLTLLGVSVAFSLNNANAQSASDKEDGIKLNCNLIKVYKQCPHKESETNKEAYEAKCKSWFVKQRDKFCKNPTTFIKHVTDEFSKWDEKLKTLSFDFNQSILFISADITQKATGTLYYEKGNKQRLRLEQKTPEKQIIWTDKKDIYIYQPKENIKESQAIHTMWDSWLTHQGAGYLGIMDFGNYSQVLQKHAVTDIELTQDLTRLTLSPKLNLSEYKLTLFLRTEDLFPVKIRLIFEDVDSTVTLNLETLNINGKLVKGIMEVDIPKKVTILDL
ncbi:MAG TPA: outer membrane lipoprotein carrier protein LolA [Elusimicrobiales bacterium]|nr:outer membrane lipoprotein carrier protein LolA [Elusimicrobiales bacterium]